MLFSQEFMKKAVIRLNNLHKETIIGENKNLREIPQKIFWEKYKSKNKIKKNFFPFL